MAVLYRWFSVVRVFLIVFLSYVVGQVCTYYGNYRYAEQQSNLSNCTWYRSMSCCRRTEVASVFGSMFKIHGDSDACHSRLNYMMCYFCSPNQIDWYDSKVVICSDFCEETYQECKEARLGDHSIGEKFESGRHFCEANNFAVVPGNDRCFSFDPTAFDAAVAVEPGMVGLLTGLCIALVGF